MYIEVKHNIKIKSGFSYLEIENEKDMKDGYLSSIYDYIRKDEKDNSVNNFLQKIGIYNDNNKLTEIGKQFMYTGKLYIKEHGKYEIEYIENDRFLYNTILSINVYDKHQEDRKQQDDQLLKLEIYNKEDVIFLGLSDTSSDYKKIKIKNIDKLKIEFYIKDEKDLSIHIEDNKIYAKLYNKYDFTHFLYIKDIDTFINKYIDSQYLIFNKENNKYIVNKKQYEKLTDKEKKNMKKELVEKKIEDYTIFFYDIELEPNEECSRDWLEYLLECDIRYYIDKDKFEEKVTNYYDKCDKFNKEYSYHEFKEKFSKSDAYFWYLHAPVDLIKEN